MDPAVSQWPARTQGLGSSGLLTSPLSHLLISHIPSQTPGFALWAAASGQASGSQKRGIPAFVRRSGVWGGWGAAFGSLARAEDGMGVLRAPPACVIELSLRDGLMDGGDAGTLGPVGAPSWICPFRRALRRGPARQGPAPDRRRAERRNNAATETRPSLPPRGRSPRARRSPKVPAPRGRSGRPGAAPQPPPSATLAGGGAGSGGGGGARPARRPRPQPRPAPGRAPAPPAPPQPQSRRAAESERPAQSAEPAGGANKAAAARAAQAPDAPSERPSGPLSRAGQERRRPRGARSAACGARRGGWRGAAAAGGVEPGPGPGGARACEGVPRAARRPPRGRTWAGAAAREEPEPEEEEGTRGGAAGTPGRPREAPPRPPSPARAGGMPRGRRTSARALP